MEQKRMAESVKNPPTSQTEQEPEASPSCSIQKPADYVVLGAFKVPGAFAHESNKSLNELISGHPILQSYCHKVGDEYVLQMSAPTSEEFSNPKTLPVAYTSIVEKIDPIRVMAVPIAQGEYAICVSESSGLFDTATGKSIIKDFKDSIITGVPVVRKSWMNEFHEQNRREGDRRQEDRRSVSSAEAPYDWHLEHVFRGYHFRRVASSLVSPENLTTLDKTFSSRLTTVAVNAGVTKFAIMTALFDLFIQKYLDTSSNYIIGSPILLRETDAEPASGALDYCLVRSVSDPSLEVEKNYIAMFHAIQSSLMHHVPMSDLRRNLSHQGELLYDYLITYFPKGLVDQEEVLMDDSGEYLDHLVPFDGAKGGLLLVEFYDDFGFRLSLETSHFSEGQVNELTETFKTFVLNTLSAA